MGLVTCPEQLPFDSARFINGILSSMNTIRILTPRQYHRVLGHWQYPQFRTFLSELKHAFAFQMTTGASLTRGVIQTLRCALRLLRR